VQKPLEKPATTVEKPIVLEDKEVVGMSINKEAKSEKRRTKKHPR
jgi:hypothetical protein